MKKAFALVLALVFVLAAVACGGSKSTAKQESAGVEKLVQDYGFQWTDTSAPILNAEGAKALSFSIYSSKNASALDYNDMKIMQDLFESTNVFVSWENVSESVYSQQKNLIFGNADNRPDAIYHAGMGAGEIIKYAKRKVLLPISDYLEYMPNFSKILNDRPDIKAQLINVEDGKIYSLPRIEEMGLLQSPNLLFLNVNWTKAAFDAGAVVSLTAEDLKDGLALTAGAPGDEQLTFGNGYDHNFNINDFEAGLRFAVEVTDPESGRVMDVFTDMPAVQFYAANNLHGVNPGSSGRVYAPHEGFCLETQFAPDSINHPEFIDSVLRAGEKSDFTTIFAFDVMGDEED